MHALSRQTEEREKALLYWSGVSWQLLALIACPAVSLILAVVFLFLAAWPFRRKEL